MKPNRQKPNRQDPNPPHQTFHGTDVHAGMDYFLSAVWPWNPSIPLPASVTPSSDPGDYHGGSPNMKAIYATLLYAAALLGQPGVKEGAGGGLSIHRERVRRILARERGCHQQGESLTTSHEEVWAGPMGTILWLAEKMKDQELIDLAVEWWQVQHAIHSVCRLDTQDKIGKLSLNNLRWGGGSRSINEKTNTPIPYHEVSAKVWEALTTVKVTGKVNKTDIGAFMLTKVSEETRKRIQQWPSRFPPLALEYHSRRYSNGDFISWFEGDRPKGWSMSAGVENGERWITVERDDERVDRYKERSKTDEPILSIDTEKGEPQ